MVWPRSFWLSAGALFGLDGPYVRVLLASCFLHAALVAALAQEKLEPPRDERPRVQAVAPPERTVRLADGPEWQGVLMLIGSPAGEGAAFVDLLAGAPPSRDLDDVLARVRGVHLPYQGP